MAIQQYLPSKEFRKKLIRVGVLLLIVVIIRFGAYPLIKNLFTKDSARNIPDNVTVKQFVDTDTDGDKLADWEESIWGTDPKKPDTDNDGISDFDYVASKKQGLNTAEQNETTILSGEVLSTLFALIDSGATTPEAFANLGDAVGQSVVKPEIVNKHTSADFNVVGVTKNEVKNYYLNFQKAYNVFAKSKAPNEFTLLSVAISAEDPDQLLDLDSTIKKYTDFENSLLSCLT